MFHIENLTKINVIQPYLIGNQLLGCVINGSIFKLSPIVDVRVYIIYIYNIYALLFLVFLGLHTRTFIYGWTLFSVQWLYYYGLREIENNIIDSVVHRAFRPQTLNRSVYATVCERNFENAHWLLKTRRPRPLLSKQQYEFNIFNRRFTLFLFPSFTYNGLRLFIFYFSRLARNRFISHS